MDAPDHLATLIAAGGTLGAALLIVLRYGKQLGRALAPNRIRYRVEIERADEPDPVSRL